MAQTEIVSRSNPPPSSGVVDRGTRLNQMYEIDEYITSGGMGEIYRGHNITTQDSVAIKMIRADMAGDETVFALFRKEASALNTLYNEAIVRYYGFARDETVARYYLVMEFVEGQSLADHLLKTPLSIPEARVLQSRIAIGLHAAHKLGIIHRDMSPDNIILPGADVGRAKIIDFGIARSTALGQKTVLGTVLGGNFAGKFNYASPEQFGMYGGDVTGKSDIYSFGLVMAEALAGKPIDMSGSQVDVIDKRRVVPDLSHIDVRMRPLIDWMLQPDPADRPASMEEVAAWKPGEKTSREKSKRAKAAGPAKGGSQGGVSKALLAAGVAGALALGGGGAYFFLLGGGGGQQQAGQTEAEAWAQARESTDAAVLQNFITRFPGSSNAAGARARVAFLNNQAEALRAEIDRQRRAEEERAAEQERQRQAAIDRQRQEQARLAEEQRKREEDERQKQEQERLRLAEEQRKRDEAERVRLAELDRQRAAEELRKREEAERARVAEEQRQRQEQERLRLAEAERQRQEQERLRLAEAERQRQEQERLRLAEAERQRQEQERLRLAEVERQRQEQERLAAAERERLQKIASLIATDPALAKREFINSFIGGPCFYVLPQVLRGDVAVVEGISAALAPLRLFDEQFTKTFSSEAVIYPRLITREQCPITGFLAQLNRDGVQALNFELPGGTLRRRQPLTATVSEFGQQIVTLLFVGEDGRVHSLQQGQRREGDQIKLSANIEQIAGDNDRPKIALAVATAQPLPAALLRSPQTGEQFFAGLKAELDRPGQTVRMSAKFFKVSP